MLDLDPPPSPPAKPKLSPAERRARTHDRLTTLRLRVTIGRELEDRGITTPSRHRCRGPSRQGGQPIDLGAGNSGSGTALSLRDTALNP